ncbi:MAG: 2OG-Fe(II) oxygenase [Gemmataceae bacterium]|nr:2OG-Fe(II) oxygenase [Gemmataceae bacterium]
MRTDLAPHLFTVAGLLSPEECRALIERGEAIGFKRAAVRTASGPQALAGIRDNDRAEFADPALAALLWERCRPFVPAMLEGGEALCLDGTFRFYRYDPGQRFKRHRDGVVNLSPRVRSRLTCLFYLNGGFVGGETAFHSEEFVDGIRQEVCAVTPTEGQALFFLHEWLHEGRPLTEGRKYVLRSDVFYRFASLQST